MIDDSMHSEDVPGFHQMHVWDTSNSYHHALVSDEVPNKDRQTLATSPFNGIDAFYRYPAQLPRFQQSISSTETWLEVITVLSIAGAGIAFILGFYSFILVILFGVPVVGISLMVIVVFCKAPLVRRKRLKSERRFDERQEENIALRTNYDKLIIFVDRNEGRATSNALQLLWEGNAALRSMNGTATDNAPAQHMSELVARIATTDLEVKQSTVSTEDQQRWKRDIHEFPHLHEDTNINLIREKIRASEVFARNQYQKQHQTLAQLRKDVTQLRQEAEQQQAIAEEQQIRDRAARYVENNFDTPESH